MDLISVLAKNIVNTGFEDIPQEAVNSSKKSIIDILGIMIAGSTAPGCKAIVDYVTEKSGKKESTIMNYGGKVPATSAALANGTMARALDFDDIYDKALIHPSVTIVPTAFAMAERQGGISGKDFITAVTLGNDLICRFKSSVNRTADIPETFNASCAFGSFGSAAIAGKIMGLNEARIIDAMGIVYGLAMSNRQGTIDGALSVRVHQGCTAMVGILAAELAQRGITGVQNVLQGKCGFYATFERNDFKPEELTSELGKKFEGVNLSVKLWPCGKHFHNAIEAALNIGRENAIDPEMIDEVIVRANSRLIEKSIPKEVMSNPQSIVTAQFSPQWSIATAIVKQSVFLEDFTEEAIKNATVLKTANKVNIVIHPEFEKISSVNPSPTIIEIKMKDGKVYSDRVDFAKGHSKNPVTIEDCIVKFKKCIPHAAKTIAKKKMEKVIEMISQLEEVDDVVKITRLLS